MNSKKGLILAISTCLVLSFIGCGHKYKENNLTLLSTPNFACNTSKEGINGKEVLSVSSISKEDKTEIARDLFDKYINENKTDWKQVEFQKLDRKPMVCFSDYKINYIKITGEEEKKFTAYIEYDIQYTNESDMWIAGNGKICEDNWIRNKSNFVEIEKSGDKYSIKNIITG